MCVCVCAFAWLLGCLLARFVALVCCCASVCVGVRVCVEGGGGPTWLDPCSRHTTAPPRPPPPPGAHILPPHTHSHTQFEVGARVHHYHHHQSSEWRWEACGERSGTSPQHRTALQRGVSNAPMTDLPPPPPHIPTTHAGIEASRNTQTADGVRCASTARRIRPGGDT